MKILIADDEKDFVYFLKNNLSRLGYSADVAYDGEKALELIKSNNYDLVFLDHNMPELTGLELAKYMKVKNAESKVVMLTGYDGMREFFAKYIGVDEYLTKPVKTKDIEDIINKYGGQKSNEKE